MTDAIKHADVTADVDTLNADPVYGVKWQLQGKLTKPSNLAALDMRLKVSGVSMGRLYALGGVVLPETPPFITEGHLIGTLSLQGNRWIYEKFSSKVGSSDITGTLKYQKINPE